MSGEQAAIFELFPHTNSKMRLIHKDKMSTGQIACQCALLIACYNAEMLHTHKIFVIVGDGTTYAAKIKKNTILRRLYPCLFVNDK